MERKIGRVKVVKTPHEKEWVIKVWDQSGKRWNEADCFEASKKDAEGTAKKMLETG